MKPIGLKNYTFLLSDPELWERFVFTGKFVFICVTLQMLIGIFVGYQLQKNFRGRDVIFTMLMMPMMLSPVVVGFLWRYMFNSEWGMVNFLLSLGRLRQDRLARPDQRRAVGGGGGRHLDVDAVHRPACHRRVPRHSRDDLRSGRGRRRESRPTASSASRCRCRRRSCSSR